MGVKLRPHRRSILKGGALGVTARLLDATLLACVFYLATGQEDLDPVGIATYVLEPVALGLVQ